MTMKNLIARAKELHAQYLEYKEKESLDSHLCAQLGDLITQNGHSIKVHLEMTGNGISCGEYPLYLVSCEQDGWDSDFDSNLGSYSPLVYFQITPEKDDERYALKPSSLLVERCIQSAIYSKEIAFRKIVGIVKTAQEADRLAHQSALELGVHLWKLSGAPEFKDESDADTRKLLGDLRQLRLRWGTAGHATAQEAEEDDINIYISRLYRNYREYHYVSYDRLLESNNKLH